MPAPAYFLISAVSHYLGPSFAVLLFARLDVLAVAWLRIVAAALVLALWRRPWRGLAGASRRERLVFLELGLVLAAMNSVFYLAIARLPLATVGAIEFLGTVLVAALGARTPRNLAALVLTTVGVAALTHLRAGGRGLGLVFAFANCALFVRYIILGHRIAERGAGLDRLAAAMLVAALVAMPLGLDGARVALRAPWLLAAAAGVGITSSVIPYAADQQAMARLPRASFALMLALLPMFAAVIGAIVLGQRPSVADLAGVALVVAGVALHRAPKEEA